MRSYEHWLLVREPHPQSLAALVLLTRKYLVATRPVRNYRLWLTYRKRVLQDFRQNAGDLVCHYCGKENLLANTRNLKRIATLDHVHPKSKGGAEFSKENLVVACNDCNQKKKDRMPL
jgi:5-methylcytosine-specific restriction endonuclease McrA